MEISKLKSKKEMLQIEISTHVHKLVENFKKETGISPSAIDIHLLQCTPMSSVDPEYFVGSCSVKIVL
jgi:hypothetical protein